MNIPKTINIGGINYQIKYVEELHDDKNMLEGLISFGDCTISLNKSSNEQVQKMTFIHEVLHGIINHMNIKLKSDDEEEELVEALSKGITQVLSGNNFHP